MTGFTVYDIAAFLLGRLPQYRGWTLEMLVAMVRWHVERGGVHVVSVLDAPAGRRLIGVALGRPVRRVGDLWRRWAWNSRGKVLCVDVVAADGHGAMNTLWNQAAGRWGRMSKVVFRRGKLAGRVKLYSFSNLERRLAYV